MVGWLVKSTMEGDGDGNNGACAEGMWWRGRGRGGVSGWVVGCAVREGYHPRRYSSGGHAQPQPGLPTKTQQQQQQQQRRLRFAQRRLRAACSRATATAQCARRRRRGQESLPATHHRGCAEKLCCGEWREEGQGRSVGGKRGRWWGEVGGLLREASPALAALAASQSESYVVMYESARCSCWASQAVECRQQTRDNVPPACTCAATPTPTPKAKSLTAASKWLVRACACRRPGWRRRQLLHCSFLCLCFARWHPLRRRPPPPRGASLVGALVNLPKPSSARWLCGVFQPPFPALALSHLDLHAGPLEDGLVIASVFSGKPDNR